MTQLTLGPPASAQALKPLLVGEDNPYGGDPRYALYPQPRNASGYRLCCFVMGLTDREYLTRFDRANLCADKWSVREARARARDLFLERPGGAVVALGAKVAKAFAVGASLPTDGEPFTWATFDRGTTVVFLPHPSGLCRVWNEPGAFARARRVLAEAGVLPEAFIEGSRR